MKDYVSLLNSLTSAADYSGINQIIYNWQYLPVDENVIECPLSAPGVSEYATVDWAQLDFVWMICVEMFGDYGTSPRFGWIEQIDEFREFCNSFCIDDVVIEY